MKKKIWIGMLCCILSGCMGCQRQDDTAGIVTEKKSEAVSENEKTEAQESELQVIYETEEAETGENEGDQKAGEALAARLGITGRWTEKIDFEDGNRITADAEILLPNTEKFPIYTVSNQSWEPEFIQQMGTALLGDETSWYDMDTYLAAPKDKRSQLAPAKPEWKIWSEPSADVLDCNQIAKTKKEDIFAVWVREQEWKNHEFYIQPVYKNGNMVSKSRNYEWNFDVSEEKKKQVEENCKLTREEAVSYAEKCLLKFPVSGFHVTGTAYAVRNGQFAGDGIEDAAYWLACERNLDGIPITFDYTCGGAFEDMNEETPLWWNNELLILFVNDKGVAAAEAYNFYDIGEKTEEDAELLPFAEICKVFEAEKQVEMCMVNSRQNYHVNKVRLGYFRTFDPGEGSLTGKLIPVWDFYGSRIQFMAGEGSYESDCSYFSMCTINAIDGSVIRRSVGY